MHLPTQETRVRSLGRGDPLQKEMATHSSILAWKIPWTEEPGRLQSMGSQRVRPDWATSLSLFFLIMTAMGLQGKLLSICVSLVFPKPVNHWWIFFLSVLNDIEIVFSCLNWSPLWQKYFMLWFSQSYFS